MRDVSHLKFIGSSYCSQYRTGASFYIDETHATGMRHLVVIYENDKSDFLAGIPDDWADEKSKLAVSGMGGASSRLWQPDAVCLVEEPPAGSTSGFCAELSRLRGRRFRSASPHFP